MIVNSMATNISDLEITAPFSSSSPPSSWDVFLSFCGQDTRANFISHLYKALFEAGFLTFRDDPALEKGEKISPGLLGAIRDSNMFLVVISENYARSSWCLKELVQILTCKTRDYQVILVFYYVEPSHIRYQKGCFGEALEAHKDHYSDDMIDKWRSALAQIAELSGYHLKKHANENESETIQQIVENVTQQISKRALHLEKDLLGIDSAVEEIYQKLKMELNHVHALGICGMGGIGKTTIAKAFYNKYYNMFDISCFIDKVKQYSQAGSPLLPLLNQVLIGLLRRKNYKVTDIESGFGQLKQILCYKKALIVLDDLDQLSYSEFLVLLCNLFSAGSRIIVTTRDANLVNQIRIDIPDVDTYMVKTLGKDDSLELFSYHAFRTPRPPVHLKVLSESFVTYAGGLPLALKVLGSSLRGRNQDESFWKAKLGKVKEIPEEGILEILQLSYDELGSDTEKAMFLDIAFFFVGKFEYEAVEIFKSCHFHPEVGIPILVERSLLTVDEDNQFQMHDLIQEMGRRLAKNTHLFLQGNAWEGLQNQKETNIIEGLILDLTESKNQISSQIFNKLPKLRLLDILGAPRIKEDFKNSFGELRCFYWRYCTWTCLPPSFQPENLVVLNMPFSNFKILWSGSMPFKSLKIIDVDYSVKLETTPDLGNSKLVKRLFFRGCESLLKLHPSIRELIHLYNLDLRECTNLKELAEPVGQLTILGYLYWYVKGSPEPMRQWVNVGYLRLGHCSNVRRLPEQLGDMKSLTYLDASHTSITELPDSITQVKSLVELNLSSCKKFRKLPQEFGSMEGLEIFSACDTAIEQLPDSFGGLINLLQLILSSCQKLKNLPDDIWKLKLLAGLYLDECSNLERLPEQLEKMQCLESLDASHTAIEKLPDSIGQLSKLKYLGLSNCENLKYIPNSIWKLTSLTHLYLLKASIGITTLPNTMKDTKLVSLGLTCDIRLWLPMISSFSLLEELYLRDEGESLSSMEPFSLSKLHNLRLLELNRCTSFGSSFPELPPSLTHLSLYNNATLINLPDLSGLKQLKKLDIVNYSSLESLPPLPPHLHSLIVYHCPSLHDLPDMSILKDLTFLSFGKWEHSYHQIAEWSSYKNSGRTLQFSIPPLLGDDFLGLALWILFTSKNSDNFSIRAVVTNKTNGITMYYEIPVHCNRVGDVYNLVRCINGDEMLIRSGDNIHISFERQLYRFSDGDVEFPYEEVKMKKCGAHVIQKSPITPNFPSFFNNLVTGV